ncbi:unnamed protein product [Nesidiocoris tenuis]|uniref:Uncharacterized protein n=1 Tax=Nesidiocoris tenuis TaxID=355587 RepID=A0A6H5GIF9_9HEMI|nr:unnamed protein product [Nesidiocoris tenuis]
MTASLEEKTERKTDGSSSTNRLNKLGTLISLLSENHPNLFRWRQTIALRRILQKRKPVRTAIGMKKNIQAFCKSKRKYCNRPKIEKRLLLFSLRITSRT